MTKTTSMLNPPVTELFTVCNWRKQLTIPLTYAEAVAFMEAVRFRYDRLTIVPYVETRTWIVG